ncbi:hypothetical protein ACIOJD_04685 [Streptomyces sp. NPDC088116]|uniref:hypothetical protein n=1 Tax=Streptomyces sp. NPDC088116 TaxID=3365825 RepID=UPI00381D3309
MADERDAWLDRDAAERLLRGEPVEAVDERVRARTERLGNTLRDMAAVTYRNQAELPGEEAALAAFRRARVVRRGVDIVNGNVYEGVYASRSDGSHASTHTYDPSCETFDTHGAFDTYASDGVRSTRTGAWNPLGTTRLAPLPRPGRPGRSGRPGRRRLAATMAGCALGGIAIVVGAGLLPTLVVDGHDSVPADSVSTVTSPGPLASRSSGVGQDPAGPSGSPRGPEASGTASPPPGSSSEPPGKGGRTDKGAAQAGRSGGRVAGEGADDATGPVGKHENWSRSGPDGQDDARDRDIAKACRDYRGGAIDAKREGALESAAGGPGETERFCDRLLGTGLRDGLRKGHGDRGRGEGAGPPLPDQPYLPHQPSGPHQPSEPHQPLEPTPSPTPVPTTSQPTPEPTPEPGRGALTPRGAIGDGPER